MRLLKTGPWIIGLLLATACASVPAPTARSASARAAIRSASEVGALGHPTAALHLKLAMNSFDKATRMMRDDQNEAALDILIRAESDAELAVVLARASRAEEAARLSEERLRVQRQQTQSSP